MLRQMFKLAVDAAKVEVGRWRNPGAEPEPTTAVEPPPAPEPAKTEPEPPVKAGGWDAEAFRRRWLASERCPFCTDPKTPGTEMCGPCDDFRKPLRAKAAKAAAS